MNCLSFSEREEGGGGREFPVFWKKIGEDCHLTPALESRYGPAFDFLMHNVKRKIFGQIRDFKNLADVYEF